MERQSHPALHPFLQSVIARHPSRVVKPCGHHWAARRRKYYNPTVTISRRGLLASAALSLGAQSSPLKIVVAGGHPGDPECGCAGTIARWTELGHNVTLLYLNRGEGFCSAESLSRCAPIRTAEAEKACAILKARAAFADQIDGRAIIDNAHYEAYARILLAEEPDAVLTQWPVDSHRDHRAVSSLTLDAWLQSGRKFALYYYEVAEDTTMFKPAEYVDISAVESRRRARLLRARFPATRQMVSETTGNHPRPRQGERVYASRRIPSSRRKQACLPAVGLPRSMAWRPSRLYGHEIIPVNLPLPTAINACSGILLKNHW
jgi:N-acetylglucosamine malate deacetylase 1